MTYDELNKIISRGEPQEWLSKEANLIYKDDLNLRIYMADREESETGDEFREDWSDALPAAHAPTRKVYWILYGSTRVLDLHAVVIDQRTVVPLSDSDDHSSMSAWRYGFGKIIEKYNADYGGIYSLDSIMDKARIDVRD